MKVLAICRFPSIATRSKDKRNMVYSTPTITKRPPKSDRFDLFSPKLNRHITLFSYWQLQLWLILETFPCINSFCERPNFIELKNGKQQLIDFWLLRVRSETLLVILNDGVSSFELAKPTQPGIVQIVSTKTSR